MSSSLIVMLVFSGVAVILGFIALLTQNIYINPDTNQPVDISIPLIGKLRTNYPALIFVIGGIYLAWSSFEKSNVETQKWNITGMLIVNPYSNNKKVQEKLIENGWNNGQILPVPLPVSELVVEKNGRFKFSMDIPKNKSFEEAIETLQFSGHPYLFGSINLQQEKDKYDKNNDSLLLNLTATSREYRLVVDAAFPPEPEN